MCVCVCVVVCVCVSTGGTGLSEIHNVSRGPTGTAAQKGPRDTTKGERERERKHE